MDGDRRQGAEGGSRACGNCERSFTIGHGDLAFYENLQVPPPTWCPDCRQKRRYAWRNERTFYRRPCDLCGKSTVTIYSPKSPYRVFCPPCWWSDAWDAGEYGREFDPSRPFFEQFRELQLAVPRIALLTKNSVSSEYTNHSADNKNCFMCVSCFWGEDNLYSAWIMRSRDCVDCNYIFQAGERLYECVDSERSYQCQESVLLQNCHDCFYCYDLRGCSDCFLSVNLRNKRYCFMNEQCSKEEYEKRVSEYRLGSFAVRRELRERFLAMMQEKALHRHVVAEKNVNTVGSMLMNCRNTTDSFDADKLEDARFVFSALDLKSSMDVYHVGIASELLYEAHGLTRCYRALFSHLSYDNAHITYCDMCQNSQNLFGCVGVKKGSFMVLNRRYDEAEYKDLVARIVAHMRETKEYGEFFPPSLSPVSYNETQGQVYMPMTRDEALSKGWRWEDDLPGTFGKETVRPEDLPDDIADVTDAIMEEVLACASCGRNYKIVRPELDFYRRETVPLPRECLECRYARRVALRAPRKLWHRRCMCGGVRGVGNVESVGNGGNVRDVARNDISNAQHDNVYTNTTSHPHGDAPCPTEFETSYAPERSEIVYCEQCYQAEVA